MTGFEVFCGKKLILLEESKGDQLNNKNASAF